MRASRAIASTALGACAACVALVVHAEPSPDEVARVSLAWRAPAGCPDGTSVRADVARLLAGSQAPVNARADVEHVGDSWRVVVAMNGGEQRLEAGSCRALADATALIVAMAVDPARVAANRASRPVADAGGALAVREDGSVLVASNTLDAGASTADAFVTAAPIVAPIASAAPLVADAAPPEDAAPSTPTTSTPAPILSTASPFTTFAVSAAGTMGLGTLPAPAVGPSIAFAWTPSTFRLELSGAYFFPDSTAPAPITGAAERFTMFTGALRGCYVARPGSFDVGPCALAEVGSIQGTGLVAHPSSGGSPWVAPGAGVFGAWRVARAWALFGRADALIPLIRPDFQVDGTTLHRPAFLTGRLSLGAELRF